MDMITENNSIELCGDMAGRPVRSHTARGQDFYVFPLEIQRLSGTFDTLNVIVRPQQLDGIGIDVGSRIRVAGQLRTFNNRRGEGARLVITVFAKEIELTEEDYVNRIFLRGTLCKTPVRRTTPMGRDICDLMLAVNRRYGRSDYLPCICWGNLACIAGSWDVGTRLRIGGRVQSRTYIKLIDEQPTEKTAYEVSVSEAAEDEDVEMLAIDTESGE